MNRFLLGCLAAWLIPTSLALAQPAPTADGATTAPLAPPPGEIPWVTNLDDPPIGSLEAIKGGTFNTFMYDYPLTFRLMGPNSNDAFAAWNRAYTMSFTLLQRHPVTDNYIPWMASHWAVMPDNRTVYYKLRPEARWTDGEPVTADDYVFAWEMMGSEAIVDPFYNEYVATYFESVEALDDLTLKVVGKQPSWRPLDDYALFPMPRHAIDLGPDWVQRANNTFQVAAGPYRVTEAITGKHVVFDKVPGWWGADLDYFRGLYNVDRIVVHVIPDGRELDYFKQQQIDMTLVASARIWAEETDFPAIQNGWAHKKRVFVDTPQGIYGLHMNLQFPLFANKDFRKAMQYLFDFDTLNKNLMYDAYFRIASAFEGTPYANPELKPYPFDPRKAREHLVKAGFTQRGPDGILVDDQGRRASFTVIFGGETIERHLTVLREIYKRAGVEMNLQLMDGATAFNRGLERKYEMTLTGRTAGFYPEPKQYFHSTFVESTNNNNIWGFGSPETDQLIETYMFDMDLQHRLDAMHRLDAIVHDEAFYIPFWTAPYLRLLYWDYVVWPEFILPKRTESSTDWQVFWIDPARKSALQQAMQAGQTLGRDEIVDVDYYGVMPDAP